jgi:hypothetical protein
MCGLLAKDHGLDFLRYSVSIIVSAVLKCPPRSKVVQKALAGEKFSLTKKCRILLVDNIEAEQFQKWPNGPRETSFTNDSHAGKLGTPIAVVTRRPDYESMSPEFSVDQP